MFNNRKTLQEIEKKQEELEKQKEEMERLKKELTKEKENLLKIKEILEDKSPKVDITNLYIFEENGIKYIVECQIKKILGRAYRGKGNLVEAYQSSLIDIFSKVIVYQKSSTKLIQREEFVSYDYVNRKSHYVFFTPICEKIPGLLVYCDKKVPLYVLQNVYYKLNNVDITSWVFDKPKTLQKTNNKIN